MPKACLLYCFRAALKRLIFTSSAIMCYVMKREDLKVFYPTPEHTPLFIKWMTSQACNNINVLLLPLQIWKQPHRIKYSYQFRVNKRNTDCFEHLHEENTKLSVNVTVSYAWIFLSTTGFLWFLQRRGKDWQNSNRMGLGCWCSGAVKIQPSEAAIQGWYEK